MMPGKVIALHRGADAAMHTPTRVSTPSWGHGGACSRFGSTTSATS